MANYIIKPFRIGTITRLVSSMLYQSENKDLFEYPLIAYYLESPEHKIIVDTGGSVPDPNNKWQPYVRKPEEEMDEALKLIGVDPADIDTVMFTHLHWDHKGNNHFFPNARFFAQKIEVEAFKNSDVNSGYENSVGGDTNYESIDGDTEEFLPGISVVLVPGHSVGSQAIIVDTEDGKYMLTGDIVPRYINWTSDPKIPNGNMDDLGIMMASYDKLAALGIDKILPGHELKVFEKAQYPDK